MKKILFLDIDNTLLVTKDMFIHIITKTDKIKLNTAEYANFSFNNLKNIVIDYSDFDNPSKIENSFYNSEPLYDNLKIIDKYVKNGWELGILTARGEEKIIKKNIINFLKRHLKNDFKLNKSNIYAVGDRELEYYGNDVYYKKLFILRKYLKSYEKVCLIDDSKKIGNLINKYNNIGTTIKKIDFINV